jgi:hypothetical protein
MRYMLLIYGCDTFAEGSAPLEAKRTRVQEFNERCRERGAYVAGAPLHGVETATTVRVRDGEAMITDGPFAETAEQLGGYYVFECRDLDEALQLAAECPMAAEGAVEVRPVREVPMFRDAT